MITVITSFYQGNQYIPKLLDMIGRNVQLLHKHCADIPVEYLIVNDSPWDPIKLPVELNDSYTLRIIDNPQNLGIQKSRIAGIRQASGELITILDQDDEIADEFLVSQYQVLGDQDVVVCNGIKELDSGNRPIYKDMLKMQLVNCKAVYLKAANQIVSPGQCMIRKDTIPQAWMDYPLQVNGSDDLFLWLLLLGQGYRFVLNNKLLYTHKQAGNNLSNSLEKMCQSDLEMCQTIRQHRLLPDKDVTARLRMCDFLKMSGYRNRGSLPALFKYPDIMLTKLFAYYI